MKRYVHLIRHGKTDANIRRVYCGMTDLPLSDEGKAELFGKKYPLCQAFYTSALQRTQQTMGIIYPSVAAIPIPDLSEYNFGEFEMKSHQELVEDPRYITWIEDKTATVLCPQGESTLAFSRRIAQGFAQVLSETNGVQDTAIVVHGGVIANLMGALFPEEKNFYQWQPSCGLGYTLTLEAEKVLVHAPIQIC